MAKIKRAKISQGKKGANGNPESYTITLSYDQARALVVLLNTTEPLLAKKKITKFEDGLANFLVNELSDHCGECPSFGNSRDFHMRGTICDGYNGQEV